MSSVRPVMLRGERDAARTHKSAGGFFFLFFVYYFFFFLFVAATACVRGRPRRGKIEDHARPTAGEERRHGVRKLTRADANGCVGPSPAGLPFAGRRWGGWSPIAGQAANSLWPLV